MKLLFGNCNEAYRSPTSHSAQHESHAALFNNSSRRELRRASLSIVERSGRGHAHEQKKCALQDQVSAIDHMIHAAHVLVRAASEPTHHFSLHPDPAEAVLPGRRNEREHILPRSLRLDPVNGQIIQRRSAPMVSMMRTVSLRTSSAELKTSFVVPRALRTARSCPPISS